MSHCETQIFSAIKQSYGIERKKSNERYTIRCSNRPNKRKALHIEFLLQCNSILCILTHTRCIFSMWIKKSLWFDFSHATIMANKLFTNPIVYANYSTNASRTQQMVFPLEQLVACVHRCAPSDVIHSDMNVLTQQWCTLGSLISLG